MTTNNTTVYEGLIPLFPIPLGVRQVDLGDWTPDWQWESNTDVHYGHRQHIGLENDQSFQDLKTQLELVARDFCKSIGDPAPDLYITQMWANHYDKASQIHQHPHPNSIISGVLYWDDDSSTTFVNPVVPQLKVTLSGSESTPYNSEKFTVRGARGRVLLFPSWLNHLGEPSDADSRVTLSFNTFSKNLGDYNRLDYLKL
jgi:uncharacterized protein (TIGR02466 family)